MMAILALKHKYDKKKFKTFIIKYRERTSDNYDNDDDDDYDVNDRNEENFFQKRYIHQF